MMPWTPPMQVTHRCWLPSCHLCCGSCAPYIILSNPMQVTHPCCLPSCQHSCGFCDECDPTPCHCWPPCLKLKHHAARHQQGLCMHWDKDCHCIGVMHYLICVSMLLWVNGTPVHRPKRAHTQQLMIIRRSAQSLAPGCLFGTAGLVTHGSGIEHTGY